MQNSKRATVSLATVCGMLVLPTFAFGSCVVPHEIVNGQPADATPVDGNFASLSTCLSSSTPAGLENSLQVRDGSGAFAGVAPQEDGELLVGRAGDPPDNATLTAGQGIAIQNAPGGITISTTGGGGGTGSVDWLNAAAVVRPTFDAFTLRTSTTAPAGATLAATVRGFAMVATGGAANTIMMAEADAPGSGGWVATMLTAYSGPLSSYSVPAIAVRDSINNRGVEFGIGGSGTTAHRFSYLKTVGGVGMDSFIGTPTTLVDVGLPLPTEPTWTRLTYDGTNLIWAFSRDGQFFVDAYTVAANDSLTHLDKVGPAVLFVEPAQTAWPVAYHILSWTLTSL